MGLADDSFRFASTFEGELLLELMLRFWHHPRANDVEYRNDLLEVAAQILCDSIDGAVIISELRPDQMNLVAAIWIAETETLQAGNEIPQEELLPRQNWLEAVKRAAPSCFCNQDDLPP